MPDQRSVRFTRAEYQAFNAIFDALRRTVVAGPDKYRVADPHGKIAHLFRTEGEGAAFVARLVRLRLFDDAVAGGPNGTIASYMACQERWVEFASTIEVVPDPAVAPFSAEEKALLDARDAAERRKAELAERRDALVRELAAAESALAAATSDIAEIDGLLVEVRAVGERIKKFVCGVPAPREVAA